MDFHLGYLVLARCDRVGRGAKQWRRRAIRTCRESNGIPLLRETDPCLCALEIHHHEFLTGLARDDSKGGMISLVSIQGKKMNCDVKCRLMAVCCESRRDASCL